MKKDNRFFKQTKLMLELIPFVATEKCFALKGGTAINFFLQDMPRLSVDIDLTYLPLEPRQAALKNMSEALARIAIRIRKAKGIKVHETKIDNRILKLIANDGGQQVVIEPNEVVRGSVYSVSDRSLSSAAEKSFELSTSIQVLSYADVYGGKLCAALDRQHPRDIFDVKLLLGGVGITDEIRKAFVVYLVSHDRPINELLEPTRKNMKEIFEREFVGMTKDLVSYEDLEKTREQYIKIIGESLTAEERQFLVSIKMAKPDWNLIKISGLDKLPAIQWKLRNIEKMNKTKHAEQLSLLRRKLGVN